MLPSVVGVAVSGCLITCLLFEELLKKTSVPVHLFPESTRAILFGFCCGLCFLLGDNGASVSFDPDVFFYGLLPLIVFDAGYALNKKMFFSNFGSICLFAFAGTMFSTFIFGFGYVARSLLPVRTAC
jgi:sodium/hydrogen exchanger 8